MSEPIVLPLIETDSFLAGIDAQRSTFMCRIAAYLDQLVKTETKFRSQCRKDIYQYKCKPECTYCETRLSHVLLQLMDDKQWPTTEVHNRSIEDSLTKLKVFQFSAPDSAANVKACAALVCVASKAKTYDSISKEIRTNAIAWEEELPRLCYKCVAQGNRPFASRCDHKPAKRQRFG